MFDSNYTDVDGSALKNISQSNTENSYTDEFWEIITFDIKKILVDLKHLKNWDKKNTNDKRDTITSYWGSTDNTQV